ncbi:hypothetical protein [Pseudomonas extremaustralis]|uniref:hypothetical protein n=1 Tax=Pseudomonas extremaustralis TaxID=359110 RepID=UPI001680B586|nr:hypothetical protein [Pseudomonas extremaustralis]
MQVQFDSPPLVSTFYFDDLLAHAACRDRDRHLPVAFLKQAWVFALFANDERGSGIFAGLHDRERAVESVSHPQLSRTGLFQQGQHADALAGISIFTRLKINDLVQIGVVNHNGKTRPGGAPFTAQSAQTLFAGGQVVTVNDPQLPARQNGRATQLFNRRSQALCAASDQGAQQRRLCAADLVIQRRQADRKIFHLPRGGMQRRSQAQ